MSPIVQDTNLMCRFSVSGEELNLPIDFSSPINVILNNISPYIVNLLHITDYIIYIRCINTDRYFQIPLSDITLYDFMCINNISNNNCEYYIFPNEYFNDDDMSAPMDIDMDHEDANAENQNIHEEECPVCGEMHAVTHFYDCIHTLCADCHTQWLEHGNGTCPVCRQPELNIAQPGNHDNYNHDYIDNNIDDNNNEIINNFVINNYNHIDNNIDDNNNEIINNFVINNYNLYQNIINNNNIYEINNIQNYKNNIENFMNNNNNILTNNEKNELTMIINSYNNMLNENNIENYFNNFPINNNLIIG